MISIFDGDCPINNDYTVITLSVCNISIYYNNKSTNTLMW